MHFVINNLTIVTSKKVINNGYIEIEDKFIKSVGVFSNNINFSVPIYDGKQLKVFPGFIDCHIHGGYGADFESNDLNLYNQLAFSLPKEGTTSFLLTSVSNSINNLKTILKTFNEFKNFQDNSNIKAFSKCLGVHLEGPFISFEKKGAHKPEFLLKPNVAYIDELNRIANNDIRMVTYDFVEDKNAEFGNYLKQNNIIGSIGHTNASLYEYEQYKAKNTINHITHLFNAMSGISNRKSGVALAALNDSDALCELIVDNHHIEKDLIKLTFKAKGYKKVCLVTDSASCKGLADGNYKLGELEVEKKGEICVLKNTNTLAGSVAKFSTCFQNVQKICALTDIELLHISSKNIADQLNVGNIIGDIKENMLADLVFFDNDYNLKMTMIEGNFVYKE